MTRRRARLARRVLAGLALSAAAASIAGGCAPSLDDRPWLITRVEIVGWKADPPEVAPGGSVALRMFALAPAGLPDSSATTWTLCHTPKPPAENRVVAADCLTGAATPDATGDPVTVAVPADACRLFGPDTPQPLPGAPATRPRDADATGGYYQPLTLALGAARAVGLERVTCDLPEASLADSRAFQAGYHPNQNPALAGLTFALGGSPVDPGAVPRGAPIAIEATWLAGAIETFPLFDRQSRALVAARETLVVSWYVTGGALDRPTTEITDDATLAAGTIWTAPDTPGAFDLVLMLRDSRGGSDAARATLVVTAN